MTVIRPLVVIKLRLIVKFSCRGNMVSQKMRPQIFHPSVFHGSVDRKWFRQMFCSFSVPTIEDPGAAMNSAHIVFGFRQEEEEKKLFLDVQFCCAHALLNFSLLSLEFDGYSVYKL